MILAQKKNKAGLYAKLEEQPYRERIPGCCGLRRVESDLPEVKRQKYISIKMQKRCKLNNGCCNWCLYLLYKILRFLFVSVWFYYLPLIFMLIGFGVPIIDHWDRRVELCSSVLEDKCVATVIPEICLSSCEKFRTFVIPNMSDDGQCIVMTPLGAESITASVPVDDPQSSVTEQQPIDDEATPSTESSPAEQPEGSENVTEVGSVTPEEGPVTPETTSPGSEDTVAPGPSSTAESSPAPATESSETTQPDSPTEEPTPNPEATPTEGNSP